MSNFIVMRYLTLAFLMASVGAANAVQPLQGRDIHGNAVAADAASAVMEYDPNLDITWLRDWNMSGPMDWITAKAWASTLTVGAYSGWSLPSDLNLDGTGPCYGANCSSSLMGYLFINELGNLADVGSGHGLSNVGPFKNVRYSLYWTSTEYAPDTSLIWYFDTRFLGQGADDKSDSLYAVAVHPGDVAAVPEAQEWALVLAGLGVVALALIKRRRNNHR